MCQLNERYRIPMGQSKWTIQINWQHMDDEEKQSKNTTHSNVLDAALHKQTQNT
jgi:hypothetical protein